MDMNLGNGELDYEGGSSIGTPQTPHRLTLYQLIRLEEYFKDCPNPRSSQRLEFGRRLGMCPRQVKSWFQNKRRQRWQKEKMLARVVRAENRMLRAENALMHALMYKLIMNLLAALRESQGAGGAPEDAPPKE